jgi:hypothetical protein
MRLSAIIGLASLFFTACALRPRYRDVAPKLQDVQRVRLCVKEAKSGSGLSGAKIEFGEGKAKTSLVSDKDGMFELPIDKRFFDENPILVVTMPAGASGYRIEPAPEVAPSTESM